MTYKEIVPAHAGGVDLSCRNHTEVVDTVVPAHAGGVDLSKRNMIGIRGLQVPAHAGGVDLSLHIVRDLVELLRPRPCGRGGFKLDYPDRDDTRAESPPMRAGWI